MTYFPSKTELMNLEKRLAEQVRELEKKAFLGEADAADAARKEKILRALSNAGAPGTTVDVKWGILRRALRS